MEASQAPKEEAKTDSEGQTEGSLLNQVEDTLKTLYELDDQRMSRLNELDEIRSKIWQLIGPPPVPHMMASSGDTEMAPRFAPEEQEAATVPLDRIKLARADTKLRAIARICSSAGDPASKVAAIKAQFD